jgi:hypothetical protein
MGVWVLSSAQGHSGTRLGQAHHARLPLLLVRPLRRIVSRAVGIVRRLGLGKCAARLLIEHDGAEVAQELGMGDITPDGKAQSRRHRQARDESAVAPRASLMQVCAREQSICQAGARAYRLARQYELERHAQWVIHIRYFGVTPPLAACDCAFFAALRARVTS